MRAHPILLSALLFLLAALSPQPAHAVAAAPQSPYWQAALPTATVEGVPLPGVLALNAQLVADPNGFCNTAIADGLAVVTVTVTDAANTPVAGVLSYRDSLARLLWTPTDLTQMTAGSTYTVMAVFDNTTLEVDCGGFGGQPNIEGTFTIVMGDASLPDSPDVPTPTDVTLSETAQGNRVCCPVDPNLNPCFGGQRDCGEQCWSDTYTYTPTLTFSWQDPAGLAADYQYYEVYRVVGTVEEAAGSYSGASTPRITFPEPAEQYCVKIRAVSGVVPNASTDSELICKSASELQPITRIEPVIPNLSACTSFPPGYDSGGKASDCGCTLATPQDTPPLGPLGFFFIAGFVVVSLRAD